MAPGKGPNRDETMPKGKWAFDQDVADAFDDMLARSIPDYKGMRDLCLSIGSRYFQDKSWVVDIGCSRGEALAPFLDRFGAGAGGYIGYEVSKPMAEAARRRFANWIELGVVDVREEDVRQGLLARPTSLTLAVLTLQFIPIEYRQAVVRNIFKNTLPGGALIVVEKVLGSDADLDDMLVLSYLDYKKSMGYTQDQIDRKKLALEGVLVPVTYDWNVNLIKSAGFQNIECFWRNLNFCAWVAVKDQL